MTALGTSGTGTTGPVTTRRRRGDTTEKVVQVNAQLELDLKLETKVESREPPLLPTWVLLVYADGDEIRSELSLARHMSEEGFIDEWLERIWLPVLRVNELLDEPGDENNDGGHDFAVPEL
jgi:hypothetical protein